MRRVQIKRLHGHVIQPRHRQAGLFTHLADRGILRLLIMLDATVHRLPRRGASRIVRALQRQHTPSRAQRTDDVDVDGSHTKLGHGWKATVHTPRAGRSPRGSPRVSRVVGQLSRLLRRGDAQHFGHRRVPRRDMRHPRVPQRSHALAARHLTEPLSRCARGDAPLELRGTDEDLDEGEPSAEVSAAALHTRR